MDPVVLKEYCSEGHFILYEAGAYTRLCSDVVLFRSMGGMHAGPSIDLIFLGLNYFEMPNQFRGVCVSRPRDELALEFGRAFSPHYKEELGDRVYAVTSKNRRFHVIAANFWVHVHTKPLRESSLAILCGDDLAKRNMFIEQFIKEWVQS